MSKLKKDIEKILKDFVLWRTKIIDGKPVATYDKNMLSEWENKNMLSEWEREQYQPMEAVTQIINLIESELLTVREELIEQVRDKKPAKLKSVRGAKNVSSARIGYIDGWNAYYEKLQPILTDIKSKLIGEE